MIKNACKFVADELIIVGDLDLKFHNPIHSNIQTC